MNYNPILVISGEPYSTFIEIFLNSFKKNNFKKKIILIVSHDLFIKQMKKLGFNFKINLLNKNNIIFKNIDKKKINIIDIKFKFNKIFDKITDKSNHYIKKSFDEALSLNKKYNFAGIINGPISKKKFLKGKYLGITEYLAYKTKKKNKAVMLIYNKKLSVSPITTHVPLKDVHKIISKKKIIYHAKLIKEFYKKKFNKNPRFVVTGLNPHCESNFLTSEEQSIIKPAIKALAKKGYKISGPLSADTLFMSENLKKFDVALGMYHDQVLTPIKTIAGFDAINITLGLPFIRISPDHGPNNQMLGKNKSNPQSLITALKFFSK